MRRAPSRTAAAVRRARCRDLSDLPVLFEKWMPSLDRLKGARDRLFFPVRVFWMFLWQVMNGNASCQESLQNFLARLLIEEGKTASASTAGYCTARKHLKAKSIDQIERQIVSTIQSRSQGRGLWQGRPVKIVDGSSLSMPDTPRNQSRYPQPKKQAKGCGFPVLRIVAMFSLATGALLAVSHDALRVAERTLFRQLWKHFQPGDIVLADRGFTSYADFYLLQQQGVDSVMRNHPRRSVGAVPLQRLGPGDWIVLWKKTTPLKWMARKQWEALPDEMTVRQITLSVDVPGFRTKSLVLATTLLDRKAFPRSAFADLYRRRWLAELFLRDIKISLAMDVLKCKTPDMVRKELYMYIIAYNLIRALMFEAAAHHRADPLRISFAQSVHTLHQWTPLLARVALHSTPQSLDSMIRILLHYIASNTIPDRPNRVEPRAKKRRPKNYQLLNKPRAQFREILHRNKYVAGQARA